MKGKPKVEGKKGLYTYIHRWAGFLKNTTRHSKKAKEDFECQSTLPFPPSTSLPPRPRSPSTPPISHPTSRPRPPPASSAHRTPLRAATPSSHRPAYRVTRWRSTPRCTRNVP